MVTTIRSPRGCVFVTLALGTFYTFLSLVYYGVIPRKMEHRTLILLILEHIARSGYRASICLIHQPSTASCQVNGKVNLVRHRTVVTLCTHARHLRNSLTLLLKDFRRPMTSRGRVMRIGLVFRNLHATFSASLRSPVLMLLLS